MVELSSDDSVSNRGKSGQSDWRNRIGDSIPKDSSGGMVVHPVEPIVLACIQLNETMSGQLATDRATLKVPNTGRSGIVHESVTA